MLSMPEPMLSLSMLISGQLQADVGPTLGRPDLAKISMLRLNIGSGMLRLSSCMLRLGLRLSIGSCMLRLGLRLRLSFRGSSADWDWLTVKISMPNQDDLGSMLGIGHGHLAVGSKGRSPLTSIC